MQALAIVTERSRAETGSRPMIRGAPCVHAALHAGYLPVQSKRHHKRGYATIPFRDKHKLSFPFLPPALFAYTPRPPALVFFCSFLSCRQTGKAAARRQVAADDSVCFPVGAVLSAEKLRMRCTAPPVRVAVFASPYLGWERAGWLRAEVA